MRQVPAVQEVHTQNSIAGIDQRLIDGIVGRRTGQGLHVDINIIRVHIGSGKSFGAAPTGQLFDHIGEFNTLIIARIGITAEVSQMAFHIQYLFL